MDFDELDELEERQRWALKEIQKTRTRQLQVAAQEQYKQWITKPSSVTVEVTEQAPPVTPPSPNTPESSAPIGLAGFAAFPVRLPPEEPKVADETTEPPAGPAPTPALPRRGKRGFAQFQEMRKELPPTEKLQVTEHVSPIQEKAVEDPDADPLHAFAQRLMVHVQEERHLEKSWEQIQSGQCGLPVMTRSQEVDEPDGQEVPALNALIAILDEEEKEEQDFERLKPYLPELGEKATSSIVAAGKDGSNPFVTQAVEVFQRFYPDVNLSSAFGDHYKEVLHAAAHRSARRGHVEHLQLKNVEKAEEERRVQEERRKLLRDLRQRRYLLQERQRALGSLGDTKLSTQASHRLPKALAASQELCGASNGLLFPGMEGVPSTPSGDAGNVVKVCFPRTSTDETVVPAKAFQSKPLGLFSSLKLGEDEEPFTLEDLTGLPSRSSKVKSNVNPTVTPTQRRDVPSQAVGCSGASTRDREELERQHRALEQQQRLERLKERRMQRDKAKALEAKPLKGTVTSWGPASEIRF